MKLYTCVFDFDITMTLLTGISNSLRTDMSTSIMKTTFQFAFPLRCQTRMAIDTYPLYLCARNQSPRDYSPCLPYVRPSVCPVKAAFSIYIFGNHTRTCNDYSQIGLRKILYTNIVFRSVGRNISLCICAKMCFISR